jgi:hypothetical protein
VSPTMIRQHSARASKSLRWIVPVARLPNPPKIAVQFIKSFHRHGVLATRDAPSVVGIPVGQQLKEHFRGQKRFSESLASMEPEVR